MNPTGSRNSLWTLQGYKTTARSIFPFINSSTSWQTSFCGYRRVFQSKKRFYRHCSSLVSQRESGFTTFQLSTLGTNWTSMEHAFSFLGTSIDCLIEPSFQRWQISEIYKEAAQIRKEPLTCHKLYFSVDQDRRKSWSESHRKCICCKRSMVAGDKRQPPNDNSSPPNPMSPISFVKFLVHFVANTPR